MTKPITHLPSHTGTITLGRVATRGERITCAACRRQIASAGLQVPRYAEELRRNLAPGYVERIYVSAEDRNASLAANLLHYYNIATFEEGA